MEVFDVEPSFESEGWTTLDFSSLQLALHAAGEEGPLPYAGLVLEVDSIVRRSPGGPDNRGFRVPATPLVVPR